MYLFLKDIKASTSFRLHDNIHLKKQNKNPFVLMKKECMELLHTEQRTLRP